MFRRNTMMEQFRALGPLRQAFLATAFTWGVTALGAATVFFTRQVSRKVLDGMLGFASGVMIAASYWSLLAPAIALSRNLGLSPWLPATIGFLTGAIFLWSADRLLPHLHIGLAVAAPLHRDGMSRLRSFWYGQLSAIVEPAAAVVGAAAVMATRELLPYALVFAAGAMIFVVVEETIPEAQGAGNTDLATMGAIVGFTVMMVLDVALG